MQCSQPFFNTCLQNDTQFCPYQAQARYPDVIGEGDVMSVRLPDGSVQSYFLPIARRERYIPYCANSYYIPTSIPIWSNNNEAWFVRSFLNTYPAAGSNQLSNNIGNPFSKCNVNINSSSQAYVQKFHNDGWTSTTDLHYFFPHLRNDWGRGCAAIQVELPKEEKSIFHYGTICNRPCNCNQKPKTGTIIGKSGCTETSMCVDEIKSTHSCCDGSRKKEKNRRKNKNHSCACASSSHVDTSEKAVTTYADQAISCTDMKGCECQTGKGRARERMDIETEIWYPRRRKSKKINRICSCDNVAACDSAGCLGSACSDTDQSSTPK